VNGQKVECLVIQRDFEDGLYYTLLLPDELAISQVTYDFLAEYRSEPLRLGGSPDDGLRLELETANVDAEYRRIEGESRDEDDVGRCEVYKLQWHKMKGRYA
jgi:hypothetical protein